MPKNDNSIYVYLIIIVIILIIFSALLYNIWHFSVDDAFITFRYALNLAEGHGIVWNIGEFPTEGYSNFLWLIIVSLLIKINLDPVLTTKFLGILSLSGIIFLYWKICNDVLENVKKYLAFTVGFIFLLVNPATAIHTVSGLETMLYALTMLSVSYFCYKYITTEKKKYIWIFSIIALISSLLRPESILFSFALLFIIYLFAPNKEHSFIKKFKSFFPFIIAYILPLSLYIIFRLVYFQDLLPLPFYVKTLSNGSITDGIYYLSEAVRYLAPFLIVIIITIMAKIEQLYANTKNEDFKLKILLITIFTVVFSSNILYFFSSLYMNFAQRFYYPSFVLIYLLTGISIVILIKEKNYTINKKKFKRYIKVSGFVIVFLILLSNISFSQDYIYLHQCSQRFPVSYIAIGNELEEFSSENLTFASIDAGSMPYLSRWNHVDMVGLNDRFISKNGVATLEYVEKKNPQLIIFISTDGINPGNVSRQNTFIIYAEKKGYIKLPAIRYKDRYYLLPYIDPKIKNFEDISQALKKVSQDSLN
ncbi:MAG: hypothetical protein ACP5C3_02310 [Methanomicrobiales archaeon]